MKSKEDFKIFVNKYPSFAGHVKKGSITWQKLYEMFSFYDENNSVFDEYKKEVLLESTTSSISFASIVNSLKEINLDSFQNNLSNIQKAVSFLEEFTKKDSKKENKSKKKYTDEKLERFYTD